MGLGNLGDALRKAGVIDEEAAKAMAARSGKGGRGPTPLAEARPPMATPLADDHPVAKALRAARLTRPRGAMRRFHWPESDGALPFLNVSDEQARGLEDGRLAIVQAGDETFLVPRDVAEAQEVEAPGCLRFCAAG